MQYIWPAISENKIEMFKFEVFEKIYFQVFEKNNRHFVIFQWGKNCNQLKIKEFSRRIKKENPKLLPSFEKYCILNQIFINF